MILTIFPGDKLPPAPTFLSKDGKKEIPGFWIDVTAYTDELGRRVYMLASRNYSQWVMSEGRE